MKTYESLWPGISALHEERNYLYGLTQNPNFLGGHLRGDRADYEQRVVSYDNLIKFVDERIKECVSEQQ